MDTQALRKGFGSAAGRAAQIMAYHAACLKAADEIDRLRRDADRYRWLRENPAWVGYDADYRSDQIDMAVDHAMTQPPNAEVTGA